MPGPSILKYGVNSKFGDPDTVEGRRSGPHKGADFLTPEGTTLESPMDGVVVDVGNNADLGRYVTIKGAEGTLTYAHGSRVPVRKGQKVRAGDSIFVSGNTGKSTGPHTHAEWTTAKGERIDPVPVFRKISVGRTVPGNAAPLTDPGEEGPLWDDWTTEVGEDGETYWIAPNGAWYNPTTSMYRSPGSDNWRQVSVQSLISTYGKPSEGKTVPGNVGGDRTFGEDDGGSVRERIKKGLGETSILSQPGRRESYTTSAGYPEESSLSRAIFSKPNRSDTAENILKNFAGYGGLSDEDAEYSLPFLDPEFGGKERATRNILRSLGHDTAFSNPYTDFMERRVSRMVDPMMVMNAAQGKSMDQRALAEGLVEQIRSGKNLDADGLFKALKYMPRDIDELNEPQQAIAQLLADPQFAKSLAMDSSGLSGPYRQAAGRAYDVSAEDYMNKAGTGGRSYLDFIRDQLR